MPPNSSSFFEDDLATFGPTIPEHFDFTPLFEYSILSMVPSVILLLVAPFRLVSLYRQPRKVARSLLHGNKLSFLALFTALQVAVLITHAANPAARTPTTLAATSLALVDAVVLCFLSHIEHLRSVRPSAIINTYLFITLLFDIARTRTLWLDHAPTSVAVIFTATLSVKVVIAVTEAIEKRSILLSHFQDLSPEATGGIYNRSFFWWLNKVLNTGFRGILTEKDLYSTEASMSSSVFGARAQLAWDNSTKTRKHALCWTILRATRRQLAVCILPRLCLIGFRFAQPLLLNRIVRFSSSRTDSDNIGWGLTGALGIVFLGLALSSGSYFHLTYRFATTLRGSLVSMIYAKTVDLSVVSLDESIAITLMSNDTEKICLSLQSIHELWAVPIELGIALLLLERQLDLAFLAPAVVAIVATVGIVGTSNYVGGAQKIWMQGIQTRVDVTTSMLGSMKAVKMLGFTNKLTDLLQGLRVKELLQSSLARHLLCIQVFFTNSIAVLAPLMTFVVFASVQKQETNSASAYTALSLVALIEKPIGNLLRTIPNLKAALACFGRIQSFLESKSRQKHVLPLNTVSPDHQREQLSPSVTGDIELSALKPRLHASNLDTGIVIDVRNASFAWNNNGENPIINDVSFSVRHHDFLFVIGPVGCGKSTFLKGLMSETPSCKGFVYSDVTEFAYVEQTPWIQNNSIRQNIVGESNIDENWYRQVVQTCALEHDIAEFPNGHETLVGSRGIALSGGQKQRLTIARAVYARKELMIIDDAFSGLDADTEEKVFVGLFGKQGLLRQLGTTVVLVTHAVHRLSYADNIVVLDASGHIIEKGSFEEIRTSGGYVQGIVTKIKYDDEIRPEKESHPRTSQVEAKSGTSAVDRLKTEEDRLTRQNGELSTYKYYFASIGWARISTSLLTILAYGVAKKMPEILIIYWTRATAAHGSEVNSFYLGFYGLLSGLSMLFLIGGTYHYFLYLVPGSAKKLHARLLKAVMGAPLHFFTSTDTGMTTNRFSQDMSVVDTELPFAWIDGIISAVETVIGAIFMCISAGYFTLTMPPIAFIVWIIQKFYLRTSRQVRLLDLEAKSPLYSHFIESLSGLVTIRAFGWSDKFVEQNLNFLDASQKPYYLLFCIQRWLSLVLDIMVSILGILLMVLVVKLRHSISPGYVGLAILNVMNFSTSLSWIVRQWTALETSIGAIARLKNFTTLTPNENLPGETQGVPDNWPAHGAVEFKNIFASYTTGGTSVVKGVSMSIKPGQKVGICGRSGSGKSSLITSLFRMLDISPESSIIIDDIDITKVPRQVTRARLNAIPQDVFFMRGSVRLNASPEETQSDANIISALRKVQLWSIVEAKGGLDADLDAEFFSHGQRQLFCLARAILKKSKIVVLDEVSSSVDVNSDNLMQGVIREEFADATVIAVAHRLDTILDFDRIAVMSDGELIEFDEPNVLLEKPSAFRELYLS